VCYVVSTLDHGSGGTAGRLGIPNGNWSRHRRSQAHVVSGWAQTVSDAAPDAEREDLDEIGDEDYESSSSQVEPLDLTAEDRKLVTQPSRVILPCSMSWLRLLTPRSYQWVQLFHQRRSLLVMLRFAWMGPVGVVVAPLLWGRPTARHPNL
jgi:hypothetical protein